MMQTFSDPFDTLFRLQRELDARRASDWLEDTTSGMGAFPPINVFQQGHDFVAIGNCPASIKPTWNCRRRKAPSGYPGENPSTMGKRSAPIGASASQVASTG